jgi:hypothetical protein
MIELIQATFSLVNIIPAILLVFVLVYWLLVIFGALDLSSFDFDIELEADAEVELEADVEGSGEASISWFNNVLSFFNIDKIPLMVFVSFWTFPMWVISVMINHVLGNGSFMLSVILLIPNMLVCLFVAKVLTMPFVKIFVALDKEVDSTADMLGQVCSIVSSASDVKMGQADLAEGNRLNIKTKKGVINKGQKGLVISYNEDTSCYIVEPYETID